MSNVDASMSLIDASTHDGGSTVDAGSTADAGGGATSPNLIVNGDAEAAAGSTDSTPVPTPPWTSTGEATALTYGFSDYPTRADVTDPDPGPADRGDNLFVGGQDDALSTLEQVVSLSAYEAAIDGGNVTFTLDGWLGGFGEQTDYAQLDITFKDSSGTALGTTTLAPVTPADRNNLTGLLERTATGSVPAGSRSVDVLLTLTRNDGAANDGYADDLSLVLSGI